MSKERRRREGRGMITSGLIVTGLGVLFLLDNLHVIPDFDVMWPVIPIIVGVALILGGLRGRAAPPE